MSDPAPDTPGKTKDEAGGGGGSGGGTSNADLAKLIGANGLAIVGAISFLLPIVAGIMKSENFSSFPLYLGYIPVILFSISAFIAVEGLRGNVVQTLARLVLLVMVSSVFASPTLFTIWDAARLRAPQSAFQDDKAQPLARPATPPPPNQLTKEPFHLEITPK